ncbi:MAG: hypothetical protein SH857_10985 [Chitinophagales bacterium]|nr:hypothetical protein [Chitinophagales bacterium]
MKKLVVVLFLISILANGLFAQKKNSASTTSGSELSKEKLFEHYSTVYDQSVKYNDFVVAREALLNMLAIKPERTGLKDTLTYLYYNGNNYVQVILVGKEILETKPDKAEILELVAVSQQNLGLLKEALESFEKLFSVSKDVYHQYNIASLQYMLKRYGECSESLNAIIASPDTTGVVAISDGKNESQQVPVKAAAFNMRGVIALEINQSDVAKQNFEKALQLFPEFILAKNNLDKVSAAEKSPAPEKKN